jgi:uncharacterized membrane protein
MGRGRLEAFSDGVIAILITILVLELKVPQGADLGALLPVVPVFLSYVLSFVYLAIYWNNITTCSTPRSESRAESCGPISTSCFGSR